MLEFQVGQWWATSSWRPTVRYVEIVAVDKGNEEVTFRFEDSAEKTRCSFSAFRKNYKLLEQSRA